MVSASVMAGTVLTIGGVQTLAVLGFDYKLAAPVVFGTLICGAPIIIGSVIVGADEYSFDCWKQIVHESDPSKSNGVTYDYLKNHVNVKECFGDRIINIWNEEFKLSQVLLNNQIYYHAEKVL